MWLKVHVAGGHGGCLHFIPTTGLHHGLADYFFHALVAFVVHVLLGRKGWIAETVRKGGGTERQQNRMGTSQQRKRGYGDTSNTSDSNDSWDSSVQDE